MTRLSAVLCALSAAVGGLRAETFNASQASFAVLRQSGDARSAGMGGAFLAVAAGADAVGWNPAGLGFGREPGLSAGYQDSFGGLGLQQVSFHGGAGRWGGLGLSLSNIAAGSFEKRGASGQLLEGSIEPRIFALRAGLGRWMPAASASFGLEAGYLNQELGAGGDSAFEGQAAVTLVTGALRLSLASRGVLDLGAPEEVGNEIATGLAWRLPLGAVNLLAAADVHAPSRGETSFNLGLELQAPWGLALRSGYRLRGDRGESAPLDGLCMGAGLAYGGFGLDYSWTLALHGARQGLSLRYQFGAGKPASALSPELSRSLATARMHRQGGRLREAALAYQNFLKVAPRHTKAWTELAGIYEESGDLKSAEYCRKQAER